MSKAPCLILFTCLVSGCSGTGFDPARWTWPFPPAIEAGAIAPDGGMKGPGRYAQFSFDWELEGAPEIMPLQVFDDSVSMWLQFPPEGAWPAVFDMTVSGARPLPYRREPPYMVLDGVYNQLELRGGYLKGVVRRAAVQGTVQASQPAASPAHTERFEVESPKGAVTGPVVVPGLADVAAEQPGDRAALAGIFGDPAGLYAVSPADSTMRQALERWARSAEWTFSPEHWAVDVDIPLVGDARFDSDFKSAVRDLLAATEMGDRPLQPCFYSNRVLRVVPYAQSCDRRGGMRAVS